MFGELIEKAGKLAMNVMRVTEIRARRRARYQAAAAIYAALLSEGFETGTATEESVVKSMRRRALKEARELEALVYADAGDDEEPSFEL